MADQDINKGKTDVIDEVVHEGTVIEKDVNITEEQAADTTTEEASPDSAQVSKTEVLTAELEKSQSDLAEAKEQVLRAYADVQNAKRRAQMDVEKAHKFALDKFVASLLPVVDSLERGLATESADENTMKEGMELTLKLFIDTLKKFNIEQVSPEGEPFNPEHHQAMSQIESPDAEPGSVINVFQKGYILNGRLVRPAMVIVAK